MDSILLPSDQAELKKQKLKIIFLVVFSILISLSIFLYWTLKDYRYTWQALKAARVLSQKMQEMKTLAILKNEPLEFRFVLPDVVEVYSVSNCAFNSKKEKLYIFEDLLNLDDKEMRTLLAKVPNEILTYALRGAGDEMKKHFFGSMSQNRASDIIEEMELRGKVTLREISQARSELLKIARRLEEQGLILIKKKKDEFI